MAFDPNAPNVGPQAPVASPVANTTAAAPPPPPAAPAAPDPNDPFAASGGGYKLANGGWVPKNHPLAIAEMQQNPQASPTAAPSTAPSAATGPTTAQQAITQPVAAGAQTPQGQPTTVAGAFQQALVNRLTAPAPSESDPAISGAITANKNTEQRGMEKTRALLAERAASQGLDQNAMTTQLTGAQGESAGRQAAFAGNAVMQQAQQQAQQLSAALALGGSMLSQQDQLAMQDKLAQLNAQIQRESIGQQGALGQGDLSLRRDLGQGNLNLGLLSTLLNNQQFGQGLSADLGKFNASANSSNLSSLLAALGG